MFKIGDIVEITEESDATGMLDFEKGKGYRVLDSKSEVCEDGFTWCAIKLENESGVGDWYGVGHFKLNEYTIVEKKECLFKEGQVVWDVVYGKGVVVDIVKDDTYPVTVKFDREAVVMAFTEDGKTYETHGRTLFFSEAKIEAATEPVFEPTLKKGDRVVGIDKNTGSGSSIVLTVIEEDENFVKTSDYGLMGKHRWDFYRLGEKIELN